MIQKTLQEQPQQLASAREIRLSNSPLGKRPLALLTITLIIILIIAVRPFFIKGSWAVFARIVQKKDTPPSAPLFENPKHEIQNLPALVPQQQALPSAEEQAQNFWAALETSVWVAPLEDWSRLHQDIPCEPFRGRMVGVSADRHNLRPDFADVAAMLMKDQPDPDPQELATLQQRQRDAIQEQLQKQRQAAQAAGKSGAIGAFAVAVPQATAKWRAAEFYGALVRLLERTKTSAPDRQPLMLWAADRVAERLPSVIANDKGPSADWREWRAQLSALGVTYHEGSEEPWAYNGDLLKQIWTGYGHSEWGERAFLVLEGHGWDMGDYCNAGAEQFRAVIQQGLPFLEQHPKSPYQLDVQLAVAQAYETWWSISLPPVPGQTVRAEEEDYEPVVYQRYQEGAEEARQKAIAYYERLLQTAPQSDHAAYARRVLPRLKLGIDTGQRRYYCIFED
jgi:hypothetical protein